MTNTDTDIALLMEKTNRRRALKKASFGALGMAAFGFGSAEGQSTLPALPSLVGISPAVLAIMDFALNLEYLEANFYAYATTGAGIEAQGAAITGRGRAGAVTVPSSTLVSFSNPNIQAYAKEIAADEIAHVNFLRAVATASGHQPVAQPAIDLVNSFNTASAAAGLGATFNPFASSAGDLNFLLGAFIFEDVGVTAYHGALAAIINKTILTDTAGILGTEAYHAATVRAEIYKLGSAAIGAAAAISVARNTLGGEGLDQGVQFAGLSNIVPTDANAVVFSRTAQLVLNIVYLGVNAKSGGFFPQGINA
jgi:hypothetical protein